MSQRVLDFLSRPEIWAVAAALSGFLTLTWVLRGAPLGQATREEPEESPASGYRDRVVASAVVGFLLVLAGAYLAATAGIPWSLPAFASGFGIVLAVLRINNRYRHVSPTLRRVLEFSNTALTASLLLGILMVGNVVAFKYGGRAIDLTSDQAFSLSSRTVSVVHDLDRPVSFTVLFGNARDSVRQLDRVRQLLDLYKAANPSKIRVDYFDPNLDAKEFEALAKRVPNIVTSPGGGIVVEYGDASGSPLTFLTTFELFEAQGGRFEAKPDRFVSTFNGEDVVTSALIRLREGKRSKIAFTMGHGELSLNEFDPSQPGLGLWRVRLTSVGIDAIEANLLRDEVPDDANLLVICGPRTPFQADELERIKSFIIRGGRLIILIGNVEPTGLEDLLRTYNVEVGQGIVVDPRYNLENRPNLVFAPIPPGSNQPIVESLVGSVVLVPNAAPLTTMEGPPKPGAPANSKAANPTIAAFPILRTSPESWAESSPNVRALTKDPDKDLAGPINVGVAVVVKPQTTSEKPAPRMVVFSSPYLADNPFVRQRPTNLDLLMNSVHWLSGRPGTVGIEAKTHESLVFAADPGLRLRLVMVPTLLAIMVIIGLGATTYLARRD
jgi:ABC-type uncharacterized transport system involved in gliding motility auxiliary subunit